MGEATNRLYFQGSHFTTGKSTLSIQMGVGTMLKSGLHQFIRFWPLYTSKQLAYDQTSARFIDCFLHTITLTKTYSSMLWLEMVTYSKYATDSFPKHYPSSLIISLSSTNFIVMFSLVSIQ